MDIGRTDGVGGPGRIDGPNKIARTTASVTPSGAKSADRVALSEKASMVSKAMSLPAARTERVAEIKKLIESGQFETNTRLEWAINRFLIENSDR
jgi:anti-sigma28 factor (negative regulator of flagellin synthesis)